MGTQTSLEAAIAADAHFAMAHIALAREFQYRGQTTEAQTSKLQALQCLDGVTRRERQHIEALARAVDGDGPAALALIREHVQEFPRDAFLVKQADGPFGLIGFGGGQDRLEANFALLHSVAEAICSGSSRHRTQGRRMTAIGLLNERPLHASLKHWYARPGDLLETPLDGFIVDILRGNHVIEIQTGSFTSIRHKVRTLSQRYRVTLVYPVAHERWIVKLPRIAQDRPVRRYDRRRGWRRRGWIIEERRLLEVLAQHVFTAPADLWTLIPAELPEPFHTAHLARVLGRPRWFAQKVAYCLRKSGASTAIGKASNAIVYSRTPS